MDDTTERIKSILNAKYEKPDINKVVKSCTHLNWSQQQQLANLLVEHEELLDGTLGRYKVSKYNI